MHLRQTAFWFFYGVAKGLVAPLLRLAFRIQVRGRERVPRTGGLLIVSNHISMCDPPILGSFVPRPVYWMAMVELFRHPVLRPLALCTRCIPVDRQMGDSSAVRAAVRRLREGECVVIFPEGGLRESENSALHGKGDFKNGAVTIARLARVPILPVVLSGTRAPYDWRNWFFRRPPIRVEFGEPFRMDGQGSRDAASGLLLRRMQELAGSVSKAPA